MTDNCHAPGCNSKSYYRISFHTVGVLVMGKEYYNCDENCYCHTHMIEQLDYLMNLVAENGKV